MNKEQKLGLVAIVLSFAVLFGVVGYINLSEDRDAPPKPTARIGDFWSYEADDTIVALDTTVDFGLLIDGSTVYCTPPSWAIEKVYFVTIFLADGTAEDFTIEVVG